MRTHNCAHDTSSIQGADARILAHQSIRIESESKANAIYFITLSFINFIFLGIILFLFF